MTCAWTDAQPLHDERTPQVSYCSSMVSSANTAWKTTNKSSKVELALILAISSGKLLTLSAVCAYATQSTWTPLVRCEASQQPCAVVGELFVGDA
eukprot:2634141-Rhodomonas_salina.1